MLWNGQTEPEGVTRRRTKVRRTVKFVRSQAINKKEIALKNAISNINKYFYSIC